MFSATSGVQDTPNLVPVGLLANALLEVRELKVSTSSGASYLDVKLTLVGGSFEKRVVFEMIMNPFDENASEGGKRMGIQAITRICEAVGIFNPEDPASYDRYSHEGATIQDVVADIDGETVPIKTKIEKGTDGHADKNKVGEWLTPNPKSASAFKAWQALQEGKESMRPDGKPPTPLVGGKPAFGGGAGKPAAPAAAAGKPGASWLKKPGQNTPPAADGDGTEPPDDIPF